MPGDAATRVHNDQPGWKACRSTAAGALPEGTPILVRLMEKDKRMKIEKVETLQIETRRYYGHVSGHIIVLVHVEDGPVGLGEASYTKADDLGVIARRYNDLLVGRDATRITEINGLLLEQDFGSNVGTPHLASAIDIALYDLNGKVQGVPVYQLLGGLARGRVYCCYPIFGWQVSEDFERAGSYLQRLVDLDHHLFRYYVSGDSALDDRFLTAMASRFGKRIRLKSLDFSGRFRDWEAAVRYADAIRRHSPYNFEQPSADLRIATEFTKRVDLPVTLHIRHARAGLRGG